ncbi:hypothetical protein AAU61_07175 [Desulfocarbo indianensis]|nr:hypothetical protein AAU61_07175 [Desulfocarbo indianensis]
MIMPMKKLHRWLGLGLGWLMFIWFFSGAVMMYAAIPRHGKLKQIEAAAPLDGGQVRLDFAQAWRACGQVGYPARAHLADLGGRPAYWFGHGEEGSSLVWADSGQVIEAIDPGLARLIAQAAAKTARPPRLLEMVARDQWTVGTGSQGSQGPFYKFALDDPQDTRLYVSSRGGEVCQIATASQRAWAWLGAVPHWLYFTVLRSHLEIWRWTIIALAAVGCLLCLSGLWLGARYFRWRGWGKGKYRRRSAYVGWRKRHHYLGLLFGLPALAWTFSGMLSLNPFHWHTPSRPTPAMRQAFSGGDISPASCRLAPAQALAALAKEIQVKRLELISVGGRLFYLAQGGEGYSRLVPAWRDYAETLQELPQSEMVAAAGQVIAGARIIAVDHADRDDLYFRPESGKILKLVFNDPHDTWLYLDQRRARILMVLDGSGRANRWLYSFLHCFDLPWLLENRWLRDPLMLALLTGGGLLCLSGPWAWWRRKKRPHSGGRLQI